MAHAYRQIHLPDSDLEHYRHSIEIVVRGAFQFAQVRVYGEVKVLDHRIDDQLTVADIFPGRFSGTHPLESARDWVLGKKRVRFFPDDTVNMIVERVIEQQDS